MTAAREKSEWRKFCSNSAAASASDQSDSYSLPQLEHRYMLSSAIVVAPVPKALRASRRDRRNEGLDVCERPAPVEDVDAIAVEEWRV